jgi:uncharacterized protein YozE (UPF0346 family)
MNRNLVGSTYGRFCIKLPQSRMTIQQYGDSTTFLQNQIVSTQTMVKVDEHYQIIVNNIELEGFFLVNKCIFSN